MYYYQKAWKRGCANGRGVLLAIGILIETLRYVQFSSTTYCYDWGTHYCYSYDVKNRVEITTESSDEYDIGKSYEKEERLRQRAASSQIGHYSDDLYVLNSMDKYYNYL